MKTRYVLIFLVISGVLFFLITGQSVQAFSIAPHTLDIELDPRKIYENTLTLYDESLKGATVKIEVKNFLVDPKTGKFDQLIEPLTGEDSWVKLSQDIVELPASGESVEVPFSITVPGDAEAGTHQISISYSEWLGKEKKDKDTKSPEIKIGIKTALVTNIFLRVKGLVIEKADIDVFAITRDPKTLKSKEEKEQGYKIKTLFEKTPVYFLIRFNNKGNVHLRPDGNIKVTDKKGNIKFKKAASEEISVAPAQSTKEYIIGPWEDKLVLGQFFVKGIMLYGNETKSADKTIEIFIFPWKKVSLAFGGLILLIILWRYWRHYNRKRRLKEQKEYQKEYNRNILRKVKNIVQKELGSKSTKKSSTKK